MRHRLLDQGDESDSYPNRGVGYCPRGSGRGKKKVYECAVTFIPADMFTYSFGEADFDLVALGFWFSHQPRQEYRRLFDVLARPLKKDGLIWMMDNNPPAEFPLPTSHQLDEHGNNYKQRTLSNGRTYLVLKNYFSRDELVEVLDSCFDIRSVVHNRFYWSVVMATPGTK